MVATEELLLETLSGLSYRDLKNFKWFLQFWLFQRNRPNVSREQLQMEDSAALLMNLMVEKCGQQSVEVTREVFMDMRRTDLVELLETSSAPKGQIKETTFSLILQTYYR